MAFRHLLEGYWDNHVWVPGDLELVLRQFGIFRDRDWLDPARLPHLGDEGLALRAKLEQAIRSLIPSLPDGDRRSERETLRQATTLYIQEAAYTWFNRLVALRCLEARVPGMDEAIKVKPDYAYRSLRHDRFCRQHPELCQGDDGGLLAFLRQVCAEAANELPLLFDPDSPFTLVAPSPDALQKCVRALSGETVALTRGGRDRVEGMTDEVFREPELLGWVYQFWNAEEKDRVFEDAARGAKIEGPDIIPATCIYTEDYMVRFLVENSLGALWAEMHPDSKLPERWQYFVREPPPQAPLSRSAGEEMAARAVSDLTFLDPACGSGHFLVYAFDLLWDMYQEEGRITEPAEICRHILERNLFGADIDERSVQIAAVALYLKAKERAPQFKPRKVNLVAANASVPPDAVQRYLKAHPQDEPLGGVLEAIFNGLENTAELGSLLQVEEQLERALERLRRQEARRTSGGARQGSMMPLVGSAASLGGAGPEQDGQAAWAAWKRAVLDRLHDQFQAEARATDISTAIFGAEAGKGLDLLELLARRYDVVATNPPYMGSKSMGPRLKAYIQRHYTAGKRDLYAAFIQRCLQLARPGGRVAMVTQQSWLFLRSFADLRKDILEHQRIERVAHLGPRAFEELSGEVVNVALFVLGRGEPSPEHRLWAARLVGPKSAAEKDRLLREAVRALTPGPSPAARERDSERSEAGEGGGGTMDALTREWRLKALTDLWTGSVRLEQRNNELQERVVPDRLVTPGLLGSIRWWFEVLVRGLGGTACDPSDADNRCPDQQGRRCVVCELFGCTGWGRKFRFEVRDVGGAVKSDQVTKGTEFILRFTPLRPIAAEEWALLDLTLRLIADYGALGGKTVLKPSDEAGRRDLPHHRDYGLVKVEHRLSVEPRSQAELEGHVRDGRWRKPPQQDFAWASLANFWCVEGKYLARQGTDRSTFNRAVGRDERKTCRDCGGLHDPPNRCPKTKKSPRRYSERLVTNSAVEQWLAGNRQESKKVFSFKEPPRTFGFQRPGLVSFDNIKARLRTAWPDFKDDDFVTGDVILTRLMTRAGVAP